MSSQRAGKLESALQVTLSVVMIASTVYTMYILKRHFDNVGGETSQRKARARDRIARAAPHVDAARLELSDEEAALADCLLEPTELEVSLDDVGGLEDVKAAVYEMLVLPTKRPELFATDAAMVRGSELARRRGSRVSVVDVDVSFVVVISGARIQCSRLMGVSFSRHQTIAMIFMLTMILLLVATTTFSLMPLRRRRRRRSSRVRRPCGAAMTRTRS